MSDALLWTVVVALRTFGNFQATGLAVATEVGLTGRIDEVHTINIHEVIVEANRQRIGHSHEATLTVGLHVVLLTADIYNDLLGLWSLNAEVGTTLLVNLRELIARDGILYSHCISRNLNLLSHGQVGWTLGFKAEVAGNSLTIAAAQLTIASGIEVQTVRTVRTVVRRNHLTSMNGLWQFVNLLLATDADTFATSLNNITYIEVHLLGLQLQVTAEVVIHLLHHASPFGIARIGLTLVHQNALDDTVFLSLLS